MVGVHTVVQTVSGESGFKTKHIYTIVKAGKFKSVARVIGDETRRRGASRGRRHHRWAARRFTSPRRVSLPHAHQRAQGQARHQLAGYTLVRSPSSAFPIWSIHPPHVKPTDCRRYFFFFFFFFFGSRLFPSLAPPMYLTVWSG